MLNITIRELQTKTTMRYTIVNEVYHSHHSEWPSTKSLQILNAKEPCAEKKPFYTVCGNANWYSLYGEEYGGSLKN